MTEKPYKQDSFLPNKSGELVAALHTSLACKALRKYYRGEEFDSLKAHGLFIHRAVRICLITVTLSKEQPMEITAKLLVNGVSSPQLFCSVIKHFTEVLS